MKLSVILITYNMAREIPRTLQALSRDYQQGAHDLEYEVILVDNGSPVPLDESSWGHVNVPVRLIQLRDAPSSPARAINIGLEQSQGEIICFMCDGAHLLTPGVFRMALICFTGIENPVVAVRYFWMGPGAQNDSIANGYNQQVEDKLLAKINWPEDGYRLYEIGAPLRTGNEKITWLTGMFESNCLFLKKSVFEEIGGVDERFILPGGGLINTDTFKRAVDIPGTTPVQLIGEGSFHQLHGGTTTNVSMEERGRILESYLDQYEDVRGHRDILTTKPFLYMGHTPTTASKIHLRDRKRN
jgi:glycosyltransferase involved in cell wall biosynthesis